jgi:hypothetical protein
MIPTIPPSPFPPPHPPQSEGGFGILETLPRQEKLLGMLQDEIIADKCRTEFARKPNASGPDRCATPPGFCVCDAGFVFVMPSLCCWHKAPSSVARVGAGAVRGTSPPSVVRRAPDLFLGGRLPSCQPTGRAPTSLFTAPDPPHSSRKLDPARADSLPFPSPRNHPPNGAPDTLTTCAPFLLSVGSTS